MIERLQRLLWGRSRAESLAMAAAEAAARNERFYRANANSRGCYVAHAPEINAGYCEVHRRPVFRGDCCYDAQNVDGWKP